MWKRSIKKMINKSEVQKRMKALRMNANLTQKDVAKIVGIKPENYQRYEYGKIEPRITKAVRIAEALHTTPQAIWGSG